MKNLKLTLLTIHLISIFNMIQAQQLAKKDYNSSWRFLAIKKLKLQDEITIANSKNKDTLIKILNDLQYDLLYNFDKTKIETSDYYSYIKQFEHWLNRTIDDYEKSKESKLKRIIEYKSWLLKNQSLSQAEYDIIRHYYLIKNTYYYFNDFWYDVGTPFIIFSKKFLDEYLIINNKYINENNFFQNAELLNIELKNFEYEKLYIGNNDFRFIGKIDKTLAKRILEGNIKVPSSDIKTESNLFFSLLQKVIDDEIYLILLLNP